MPVSLPRLLLLLGSIEHAAALALFGRQPHHNNTILSIDKRQGSVFVTQFSTIFVTGDASNVRTANPGFDCRVDLLHDLWGFCPNTVIAATDCGLAGSCVDSFSCSKGCGFTNAPLTTFTCSESRAPFCSTALLTLSNNVGPFTYLACGAGPSTDQYFAFTTSATPSSSPKPTPSTSTSSSSRETASTGSQSTNTASGTPPSPASTQTTSPSNTTPPGPVSTTDTSNSQSTSSPSTSTPNNTGAIIGGTFGCLALLCVCAVIIFWLRHRNRHNAAGAAAAKTPKTLLSKTPNARTGQDNDLDSDSSHKPAAYQVAELSARTPAAYDPSGGNWRVGVGYPPMTPVELPGSGLGVEEGGRD